MSQRRNLMHRPGRRARAARRADGAILLAGCGEKAESQAPAAAAPPPAVTVVTTRLADVTPTFGFNGRVVAEDKVDLRARVTGFLEQRLFEEGADVKAGDLLFVIEKDTYQAVVDQRQAELASAEANRANTAVALQRGEELVKNKNIPQAEVDQRRAADQMAAASILDAQAALKQAQINLGYTDITRADRRPDRPRRVSVGNLVGPDSGVLRDHRQPGPDLRDLPGQPASVPSTGGSRAAAGSRRWSGIDLPDDTLYPHPGSLDFLDIQVDARHRHGDRAGGPSQSRPASLVDGEFVSVKVEAGAPERRLMVPQARAAGRPGRSLRAGRRRRQQGRGAARQARRRGGHQA